MKLVCVLFVYNDNLTKAFHVPRPFQYWETPVDKVTAIERSTLSELVFAILGTDPSFTK